MLNAAKNSKWLGIIFMIIGMYDFYNGVKTITNFIQRGNSIILEDIGSIVMLMLGPITQVIVGYGLYKKKLWSVYGIALLAVVTTAMLVWASSEATIKITNLLVVVIYFILFVWFFVGKKDFLK